MFIVVVWKNEFGDDVFTTYMSKHPWSALETELARFTKWTPDKTWSLKKAVGVELFLLPGENHLEFNSVLDTEPSKRRLLWTEVIAAEIGHLRLNPLAGHVQIYDLETAQCTKRELHAGVMLLAGKDSSPDKEVIAKLVACAAKIHSQN